jgi:hypothetical protein
MIAFVIRAITACSAARATTVLTEYRAAVTAEDYSRAAELKTTFAGYTSGARRAALAAVYGDVLPSHRVGYAFGGRGAVMLAPRVSRTGPGEGLSLAPTSLDRPGPCS